MKSEVIKGIGFGLTSGIITTLGLIVGLSEFTGSRLIIIGGILTIAIADAFSDAFGMHMSEESDKKKKHIQIWKLTFVTFLSKLIFALTFIIPVVFFEIKTAIWISIIWGGLLLVVLNYAIAKRRKANPFEKILEHIIIAGIVLVVVHFVGRWISNIFV